MCGNSFKENRCNFGRSHSHLEMFCQSSWLPWFERGSWLIPCRFFPDASGVAGGRGNSTNFILLFIKGLAESGFRHQRIKIPCKPRGAQPTNLQPSCPACNDNPCHLQLHKKPSWLSPFTECRGMLLLSSRILSSDNRVEMWHRERAGGVNLSGVSVKVCFVFPVWGWKGQISEPWILRDRHREPGHWN